LSKHLVVVAGPTATGKTDLSILLAKHFHTEIISADSRQFYREMNIGTAKPAENQLSEAKHHFINSLSITSDYNAGIFETECIALLDKLFEKHELLILSGGSGLYINAVLNGMGQLPKADKEIRASLKLMLQENGISALQKQLNQFDPEYFKTVDQNNPQRLMRALEVCIISGKKYSSFLGKNIAKRNFIPIIIGLHAEKELLYERINKRVDEMIAAGLAEEVKSLLPYKDYNSLQTVGYKELVQFLEGKLSLAEAIELIKKNTRSYAKRQMTWFKKMNGIKWFEAGNLESMLSYINAAMNPKTG
jgi:tRNA dimethylallyltransferase